jgi:hypothetical protein
MASRLLKVRSMTNHQSPARPSRLCYLKADQIRGPLKSFDHLQVMDRDNDDVGHLDGIVIDAAARRMQYFVVEQGFLHHRRYLVPLSSISLDTHRNVMRLDVDKSDVSSCERFDPKTYRPYSDEDVVAAMFHGYDNDAEAGG